MRVTKLFSFLLLYWKRLYFLLLLFFLGLYYKFSIEVLKEIKIAIYIKYIIKKPLWKHLIKHKKIVSNHSTQFTHKKNIISRNNLNFLLTSHSTPFNQPVSLNTSIYRYPIPCPIHQDHCATLIDSRRIMRAHFLD